ncbi:SLOG family protein [Microcoleus sp. A006_D1]
MDYQIAIDREINQEPENMEYHTAFFTGHRNINDIRGKILRLIHLAMRQGVREFWSGMAFGTDLLAAEILVERGVRWKAIIPCPHQSIKWSQTDQDKYQNLIENASERILISKQYTPTCMMERNAYMVKNADLCLAIWDGRREGGTFHTIQMARKANKLIFQFNPKTDEFSILEPPNQLSLF